MQSKSREMMALREKERELHTFLFRYCVSNAALNQSIKLTSLHLLICVNNENIIKTIFLTIDDSSRRKIEWIHTAKGRQRKSEKNWMAGWLANGRKRNKTAKINVKIFYFHVWFIWFLSLSRFLFRHYC